MATNDGGRAFPQHVLQLKADKQSSLSCNYGMSLRDWFAGQALAGAAGGSSPASVAKYS